MTRIFTLITLMFALVFNMKAETMAEYHEITNGEEFICTQENIEAADWVSYSKTNYSGRTKCNDGVSISIPNLSSSDRYLTFNIKGCEYFNVKADGNGARQLTIEVDGIAQNIVFGNNCTIERFPTNNAGDCVIKEIGKASWRERV